MMKPWRPLAFAAVVSVTLGVGVGTAQTVVVTNAPAALPVELVLNTTAVGSAEADSGGYATIPVNLAANAGKSEADVYIYIDVCASTRRVLIAERGQQPPAAGEGCDRTDMGLFLLRRVSTLVVNLGGPNPTVLLVQGKFDPRAPRPIRGWNAAPTGLVLFGGGTLRSFSDAPDLACGDVTDCSGGGFNGGYTVGATHWIMPFVGAEVTFVKPAEALIEGSGDGYQFSTSLDARVLTIAGKLGIPAGPLRVYGKAGGAFHQATFATTQSTDDTTVTVDGVSQTIEGGTQTFELKTEGWGWVFGGGLEVWVKPWWAIYGEASFSKLKGNPVDDADGEMSDRLTSFVLGARIHIGR